jgi:hypothetical protein
VRKILIVGAGHAGLQLAHGLLAEGYDVTVMSARTAAEIRGGYPTSTQGMFGPAIARERTYGLNLWEDTAPRSPGVSVALAPVPGTKALTFYSPWEEGSNSIDQRVKMSAWLELFEERGGRVIYHPVMTSDLADLSALYDLTIIAAGKGEIVELFDRDERRSKYTEPSRMLSAIYTTLPAATPDDGFPEPKIRICIEPGVVEFYTMQAYSVTGPCQVTLIEATPGSAFDIFRDRPRPEEYLRRLRPLIAEHLPWESVNYAGVEPVDPRATLAGAFPTTVRHPTAEVAPGRHVLGIGDVVVVNDPVSGQGANNASHSATLYLQAILERGGKPFDRAWMEEIFEKYWETHARHSIALTEVLLEVFPEDYQQQLLGAAAQYPEIATRFGNLFPYPQDIHDFILDRDKALAYLASVTGAAAS